MECPVTTYQINPQPTVDDVWAAAVQRATTRKRPEAWAVLPDGDLVEAAALAAAGLTAARRRASMRIVDEHRDSEGEVDLDALIAADPDVHEAAQRAAAADAKRKAAEVRIHLRALPPDVYDALQLQHPPTDEQEKRGMIWNPHTFFPALLAACSVKPLSEEQAAAIISAGNAGDVAKMMGVCRTLNEHSALSLGKG
jgi:hypothetical protein